MFQANMTAIIPSVEYSVVIFQLENPPISCLGIYRETFRTIAYLTVMVTDSSQRKVDIVR